MRRARLQEPLGGGVVACLACERRCRVRPGARGACGNYANVGGVLWHAGYGKLSAVELRPIEIKPLFHYWPNSLALTYSNFGCNFHCPWCQNHHLSFSLPPEGLEPVDPEALADLAVSAGAQGISASFNEPITNLDYVVDASEAARKRGLYSMMVTNMYFTTSSLRLVLEAGVDGFAASVKGCPSARRVLANVDHYVVFRNARVALDSGAHVEIVYLVVPGANDSKECYEWVVGTLLDTLGPEVPLHVNRYYPAWAWREPPTPLGKLLEVRDYAVKEGVKYVYVGNVHDPELESTRCPRCGKTLVRREGYRVVEFNLDFEGGRYKCPRCGEPVPIKGRYVAPG
ncbi:radical SAM protein [Thermofilum pendens]|uniref:Radical SAM domain protein n=1 Tax=Thermofilum pendens (strain DSM 2475 / Hrk 5) TaxID=368408 RepID=A1S087_THEPD|nr:radical SAM protein [Thermofilum pendens]ABL78867.1 Radical SAM domain protein [Thermofilum pendens Hrk 5]